MHHYTHGYQKIKQGIEGLLLFQLLPKHVLEHENMYEDRIKQIIIKVIKHQMTSSTVCKAVKKMQMKNVERHWARNIQSFFISPCQQLTQLPPNQAQLLI